MAQTIELGKNRQVRIDITYGEKLMSHLRNAPEDPHKTTTVSLSIKDGPRIARKLKGICYCSPMDNFSRIQGRKMALRRALDQDSCIRGQQRKPLLTRTNRRKIYEALFPQFHAANQ